ncbi:siderophore ABC transporter substrate-binding protein [Evansella cellulosilytica]|uniref:Periplasmic binding protein n=1 Tax=Evansella cellulosilytica (strain ATCC 21833 / DSM 2522 / FERM P-1141 / JCM 9156 / N-4) TaxID=649639 RepID=E6TVW6_EVAC2|nr:siderophore ABC transporter substrate-binding protein [Evansella cellulosilytica]ADU28675.1 periplasmic binding protein [Evansella cellulosilytica DSM 2522]
MKKSLLLVILAFSMMMLLAACGSEDSEGSESSEPVVEEEQEGQEQQEEVEEETEEPSELTITHELGDITVPVNPEKVVVFDMNALETLDKMGVNVTGVPQANIPAYLSQYEDASYENVGTLFEIDYEKLAEINPDLIITGGRQAEQYDDLSELAPVLHMSTDYDNFYESFQSNMTTLGQVFNQEAFIAKELQAIDDAIAALNEKVSSEETALVVLANSGNVNAYGTGSRFGIIHEKFGFTPVDESIEVTTHGMNISFEYIVDKDPDYIFVVDRDLVVTGEPAAQDTIENELVQNTKAYQNGNIHYLNPDYWYIAGGGIVSVSEMVKAIEEALQ